MLMAGPFHTHILPNPQPARKTLNDSKVAKGCGLEGTRRAVSEVEVAQAKGRDGNGLGARFLGSQPLFWPLRRRIRPPFLERDLRKQG